MTRLILLRLTISVLNAILLGWTLGYGVPALTRLLYLPFSWHDLLILTLATTFATYSCLSIREQHNALFPTSPIFPSKPKRKS